MSHPLPGITNRPPEHLLLAALDFSDGTPSGARIALDGLANVIRRELQSDLDPRQANKDLPSAETGQLGFDEGYDRAHLTITVGFSASALDAMGVPAESRPQDLRHIPWSQLGDTTPALGSGDVLLQICSDDVCVCEHVVRRVEQEHGDSFSVVWTQIGAQRYTTRTGRTSREEGRALIGFLDGSSNLNLRRSDDDARLVFVDPRPEAIAEYPVPAWTDCCSARFPKPSYAAATTSFPRSAARTSPGAGSSPTASVKNRPRSAVSQADGRR